MSVVNKPGSHLLNDVRDLFTNTEIDNQLRKILSSSEFHATSQQRAFLTFIITKTLAGSSDTIKGYTIATQVFGRDANFNSATDPIVSIQANKLRRALERYYLTEGKLDQIRIDIPKGAYVPVFIEQLKSKQELSESKTPKKEELRDLWPSILILPFKNETGDPEQQFLGSGIATELAIELSGFENINVLYPRDGLTENIASCHPRFILEGRILKTNEEIRFAVLLLDTKTSMQIWGNTYQTKRDVAEIYRFKEQVVHVIATIISGEFGVISRTLTSETRHKPPTQLNSYEALLRFWDYEQRISPRSFRRALEALTHAVKEESSCCQTTASLAIMYGNIFNLDIAGFENPLERAVEYAQRAATINPNNQRVAGTLAYIRFISNDLSAAIEEVDRAHRMNPKSLFFLDGLAYLLILCGEFERGAQLAHEVIRLNPYHRAVLHDGLWVNYLRQEQYDLAYKESLYRRRQELFWDPLILASTLGLLKRYEEGRKHVKRLLALRPDFPEKGRRLICNYVKFEEISDRIIDGLKRVGLQVN